MPAVLPRRGRKVAAVLSVAVGALALGGVSSAQASPTPCEWYDCDLKVEVNRGPIPPECMCELSDFYAQIVQPELAFNRLGLASQVAAGPGPGLDANRFATVGFQP